MKRVSSFIFSWSLLRVPCTTRFLSTAHTCAAELELHFSTFKKDCLFSVESASGHYQTYNLGPVLQRLLHTGLALCT